MQRSEVMTELEISRQDFAKNDDVIPVSDPHIFSETQRMAQMQAIVARADAKPDLYNLKAVEERLLKQMKVPNVNELLKDVPAPEQRTSADENAAMMIGQPAYAYIQQDHIAHMQDHIQFYMNPFLGKSPFADPNYLNSLIEHLKQHMMLWYINRSNGYVEEATKKPITNYDQPEFTPEIDKLDTTVGAHVALDSQQVFSQFQQQLQVIMQDAQQRQQAAQQLPPDAQVVKDTSMAETQRKTQKDQQDVQIDQARMQIELQKHQMDNQTKIAIKNAELTHKTIQNNADNQSEERQNMVDNQAQMATAAQNQPTQGVNPNV
jgi:hypothetical protein